MDELRFRRLKALREALDQPFFDQAVAELKREIADEMDPVKSGALRAVRVALTLIDGKIDSYLNDLMVVERKTEQKTHG